ncbi:hypothetical protein F5Y06DRAFT_289227 [Hypoxylon sp. FL0890]|nr:hypothetical protein F5Y06DRAFT_289227 [Hypoxylon sp. FL0890]
MGKTALHGLSGQPFVPAQPLSPLPFTCTTAPYNNNKPYSICHDGYFPFFDYVSDTHVKIHTSALSRQIAEDFQYLKKPSSYLSAPRLELLNNIADLYPEQDVLLHLFSDQTPEAEMEKLALKYIDTWYLSYLDSKTLSGSYLPMMALLHYRTSLSPPEWAIYDTHHIIHVKQTQVVPFQFNSHLGCIRAHRHEIVGYGKGLLVLKAQAGMLEEIGERQQERRQCFSNRDNQMSKWQHLISTDFTIPSGSGKPQATAHIQRPVGILPAAFDPVEVFDIVNSIYNVQADELYLMQTDPRHMQCTGSQLSMGNFPEHQLPNGRWILVALEVVTAIALRKFWWEAFRVWSGVVRALDLHVYFIKNFIELSPEFHDHYEWVDLDSDKIGLSPEVDLNAFNREFLSATKQQQRRIGPVRGPTLLRLVGKSVSQQVKTLFKERAVLDHCKVVNAPADFVNRVKESLTSTVKRSKSRNNSHKEGSRGSRKRQQPIHLALQLLDFNAEFVNRVSGLSDNLKKTVLEETSTKKSKTKTRGHPHTPPPSSTLDEQSTTPAPEPTSERIIVTAVERAA